MKLESPARLNEYRADIDGLRGLAVLGVVIFHSVRSFLPGGFAGVDVFFVISGYLITRLILSEQAQGAFSLRIFFERRVKRLLPPLLLTIALCLVVGHGLLMPGEYAAMATSALAALGFVANIYFWRNTDYFDPPAETMPLLHLWSLGVEEQFYLAWPFALVGATHFRLSPKVRLVIVSILATGSFLLWLGLEERGTAFFLPFPRAWELLIGCLAAMAPTRVLARGRTTGALIGLVLMVYSFGSLEASAHEPLRAAVPAAATVLVILCSEGTTVGSLLSLGPLVRLGKASYSLYLIHWPLLVFVRQYNDAPQSLSTDSLWKLGILAGLFSLFMWRWIERPIRESRSWPARTFGLALVGSLASAGCALAIVQSKGFVSRHPEKTQGLLSSGAMWEWSCPKMVRIPDLSEEPLCTIGADWSGAQSRGILWGDSHAEHFAPLLDGEARAADVSVLLVRSCPPFVDGLRIRRWHSRFPNYSRWCAADQRRILGHLERTKISVVILAAAWAGLPEVLREGEGSEGSLALGLELMGVGLREVLASIEAPGRTVSILGDVPRPERDMVPCVARRLGSPIQRLCRDVGVLDTSEMRRRHAPTDRVLRDAARNAGAVFIPTVERLCRGTECDTWFAGEFIYRDTSHIRRNLSNTALAELGRRIGLNEVFAPRQSQVSMSLVSAPPPHPGTAK